jgi:glucose/arabinose dehydrogenase
MEPHEEGRGDIVMAKLNENGTVKAIEPFLSGFLENNKYVGRPADVALMKDGSATSARIIS